MSQANACLALSLAKCQCHALFINFEMIWREKWKPEQGLQQTLHETGGMGVGSESEEKRKGKEKEGKERNGAGRKRKGRIGKEWRGQERTGQDRNG